MLNPSELAAATEAAGRLEQALVSVEALYERAKEAANGHGSDRAEKLKSMRLEVEKLGGQLDALYS